MSFLVSNPTASDIRSWVNAERQAGTPPGTIHRCLTYLDTTSFSLGALDQLLKEMQALFSPLVDRDIKGMALEKVGDLEVAMKLYEANIQDGFDGSHPYDRLRILYKRKKDFASAIKVCEAFLKTSSNLKYPDQKLCDVFAKDIAKLSSMVKP